MITNQVLQNTIEGIVGITNIKMGVFDNQCRMLAGNLADDAAVVVEVANFIEDSAENKIVKNHQLVKINEDGELEYILVVDGASESDILVAKMAAYQIKGLLVAYKERFDKDNFIKNLLLDNLLLVDIYNRAKKLHIDADAKRVVYIVETKHEKDSNALEIVRTLFSSRPKDFITAVDEKNIIIVKEVKSTETFDDLLKLAKTVLDMLNT